MKMLCRAVGVLGVIVVLFVGSKMWSGAKNSEPVNSSSQTAALAEASPQIENVRIKTVKSITVRGHKISVGDTFDSTLVAISPGDMTSQSIHKDKTGGMMLLKYFNADGKKFCLTVARTIDPGPYKILVIDML